MIAAPRVALAVAVALASAAHPALAQGGWLSPHALPAEWTSTAVGVPAACPPTVFRYGLSRVDEACCGASGSSCTADGVSACTVQCAARFRSFMRECNSTMELLFDAMDGATDGAAARVDSLHGLCRAIPATDVIAELSRLQDAEGCVLQTDGVAEISTALVVHAGGASASCADTRDNCATGISSGFMTCGRDFCVSCRNAGDCDLTCGLCGGHRRAQINLGAICSALNLAEKVEDVNAACCDNGACESGGGSGMPRICDAKCAMVYAPFYRSCGYTLGQQGFVSALISPPIHVPRPPFSSERVSLTRSIAETLMLDSRRSSSRTSLTWRGPVTACRWHRCWTASPLLAVVAPRRKFYTTSKHRCLYDSLVPRVFLTRLLVFTGRQQIRLARRRRRLRKYIK